MERSPGNPLYRKLKWLAGVAATVATLGAARPFETPSHEPDETSRSASFETKAARFTHLIKDDFPAKASPEDIDPRYSQIKEIEKLVGQKTGNDRLAMAAELGQTREDVYLKKTGWANAGRQEQFNLLLGNKEIREKLMGVEDLTIAEAFSLIKSLITNQPGGSYPEALDQLLQEREELLRTQWVGPNTGKVIIFSYAAGDAGANFRGPELAALSRRIMNAKGSQPRRVALIETARPGDENKINENAGVRLIDEINAAADTVTDDDDGVTIIINSHANEDKIAIDLTDRQNPVLFDASDFARAVFNGWAHQRYARKRLQPFNIIFDGCKGKNFIRQFHDELYKIYREPDNDKIVGAAFDELPPVRLVSTSEDDSWVTNLGNDTSGLRALVTPSFQKKIIKEGAIDGRILMHELQPASYLPGGDMTFSIAHGRRLTQVSENDAAEREKRSPVV